MARPRLTPALAQQIVAGIRSGGYPHVAAQAFGVSPAVLEAWLRAGADTGKGSLRAFARQAAQAFAQARLRAEIAVLEDAPRIWLERGPGRERPDLRGWSVGVRPHLGDSEPRRALDDPELAAELKSIEDDATLPADARRVAAKLLFREAPRRAA